jgi:hypothetical protein
MAGERMAQNLSQNFRLLLRPTLRSRKRPELGKSMWDRPHAWINRYRPLSQCDPD